MQNNTFFADRQRQAHGRRNYAFLNNNSTGITVHLSGGN